MHILSRKKAIERRVKQQTLCDRIPYLNSTLIHGKLIPIGCLFLQRSFILSKEIFFEIMDFFSKCPECDKEMNISFDYCQPCNSDHFLDNFPNWTSGDDNIDNLIRESQLDGKDTRKVLEWIE